MLRLEYPFYRIVVDLNCADLNPVIHSNVEAAAESTGKTRFATRTCRKSSTRARAFKVIVPGLILTHADQGMGKRL